MFDYKLCNLKQQFSCFLQIKILTVYDVMFHIYLARIRNIYEWKVLFTLKFKPGVQKQERSNMSHVLVAERNFLKLIKYAACTFFFIYLLKFENIKFLKCMM